MSSEGKYTNIEYQNFFEKNLSDTDPEIYKAINDELARQQQHIELIASENIVSNALLEAQGSVLTNKYAEGYPEKRNSFHAIIKTYKATDAIAGKLSGIIIFRIMPNQFWPSMIPASSISLGILLKYPCNI